MKVILDVPEELMGQALSSVFEVRSQNPTQKVGKEFGIETMVEGLPAVVIRNLNSYTIREKNKNEQPDYQISGRIN